MDKRRDVVLSIRNNNLKIENIWREEGSCIIELDIIILTGVYSLPNVEIDELEKLIDEISARLCRMKGGELVLGDLNTKS